MTDTERQITTRQRQWAELPPAQRIQRIHTAILGVVDLARWRRKEQQRQLAAQPQKAKRYEPL